MLSPGLSFARKTPVSLLYHLSFLSHIPHFARFARIHYKLCDRRRRSVRNVYKYDGWSFRTISGKVYGSQFRTFRTNSLEVHLP